MKFPFPARVLLLLLMAAYPPAFSAIASASDPPFETIQGKLEIGPQAVLHVATASGEVAVTSTESSILHTLQDRRMNGREVRLEGQLQNPASSAKALDVAHVFTVHDSKLFRLRFYCHVCNIPATQPGPCVCCQRWTDLEEIPVSQVTDDMVLVP